MTVLKLGGGVALSAFRLDKLNARIACRAPGLAVASARFWHFVEIARDARRRRARRRSSGC